MIMYLILLSDVDVFEELMTTLYAILRTNCLYNKGMAVGVRGEDYFKKSRCRVLIIGRFCGWVAGGEIGDTEIWVFVYCVLSGDGVYASQVAAA